MIRVIFLWSMLVGYAVSALVGVLLTLVPIEPAAAAQLPVGAYRNSSRRIGSWFS